MPQFSFTELRQHGAVACFANEIPTWRAVEFSESQKIGKKITIIFFGAGAECGALRIYMGRRSSTGSRGLQLLRRALVGCRAKGVTNGRFARFE